MMPPAGRPRPEQQTVDAFRTSLDVLYSQTLASDLASTTKLYGNYFDRHFCSFGNSRGV